MIYLLYSHVYILYCCEQCCNIIIVNSPHNPLIHSGALEGHWLQDSPGTGTILATALTNREQ